MNNENNKSYEINNAQLDNAMFEEIKKEAIEKAKMQIVFGIGLTVIAVMAMFVWKFVLYEMMNEEVMLILTIAMVIAAVVGIGMSIVGFVNMKKENR